MMFQKRFGFILCVSIVVLLLLGVQVQAEDQLEIFSWWTSGGEAAALDALFDVYKASYPEVEIVNATVAGGDGSATRGVLQTRLAGGNPPDTWQVHPGFELIGQYVELEFVASVTDLYEEQGWFDVTPKALTDLMTVDGEVYLVTVGVIGPEKYQGLWDGSVAFDAPEVKEAMEVYAKMLDYQNSDHSALSWDQAVKKVIEGACAFNSMGDWAYGEFVNAGLKDNVDFGWVSHPGSAGSFVIVADGFIVDKGAPNEEATKNWLRSIGSKEAQEAFDPLKGSICARTDCDRAKFGPYHNWSMDSFASDALVPTLVHGSAAPEDFQQAFNDAVTSFVVDRNVNALAKNLVQAARFSGFGK